MLSTSKRRQKRGATVTPLTGSLGARAVSGAAGPHVASAGCLCFSVENLSLASHIDSSLNRQVASDCVWAADNDRHY